MKKSALYQKSGGRPGSGSPVKLGWGTGARIVGGAFTGKYVKDEYDEKTKEDRNKPWYEKGGEVLWDNTGGLVFDAIDAGKILWGDGKANNINYPWGTKRDTFETGDSQREMSKKEKAKKLKRDKAYYDRSTNMLGTPKW